MKTIRLIGVALFTVLMSVGFSACGGSDDDNGDSSSNPLVGTWRAEYDERGELRYCEFTFNANFTWSMVDYRKDKEKPSNPDNSGTYVIKDNTITITDSKGYVDTSRFTITDGNKLVFLDGELFTYYKIK